MVNFDLGDGNDSAYGAYYHGNEVFGDAGNDYLEGSRVHGGDGDDTINVNNGTGIDFTFGDAGNDTINIWSGNGTVDGGAGFDMIKS